MQKIAKNDIFGHFINVDLFDMADFSYSDRLSRFSSIDSDKVARMAH